MAMTNRNTPRVELKIKRPLGKQTTPHHTAHNNNQGPYFDGETTSKQNLLSMSSHGFTEHSRRSSTTTVRESCAQKRYFNSEMHNTNTKQLFLPDKTSLLAWKTPGHYIFTHGKWPELSVDYRLLRYIPSASDAGFQVRTRLKIKNADSPLTVHLTS